MIRPTALSSRLTSPAFAVAGALVVAAGIFVGLPDTPLNLYDVSFSLLWGRELLQGTLPNVHLFGASTPHPAAILTGALAALFDADALVAMRAIVYIAAGGLVVGFIAVGRALRLRAYAGRSYVTRVESVDRGGGATRSGGL
jgi:hypothetical protein